MNFPRIIALCILTSTATILPAFAQQSLTLSLETPSLESRTDYNSNNDAAPEVKKAEPAQEKQVKVENGKQVTIGRVAVVETSKTKIYSRRSTTGKIYAVCDQGIPLAIVGEVGSWYGVLMIDGSTGWIQKSRVRLLDYQLVASRQPSTRGEYATSRGSHDDSRGTALGNRVVQTAFQYMGVPYVWGGNTVSGIDCSGFLKKVFAENGMSLPRTAREQANVGMQVTYSELQPGDRLYFCYKNSYIDHCGIYIGDNMFIHSSVTRGGVGVDKIAGKHAQALICAMR